MTVSLRVRSGRLIHGGQLLNGLAGPTVMSAGPLLSTTWFAPDQRATATAVASLVNYLGAAASFMVGPLLVPAPNDSVPVTTLGGAGAPHDLFIRDRIQLLMYSGMYPPPPPTAMRSPPLEVYPIMPPQIRKQSKVI